MFVAYGFSCSSYKAEQEILRVFRNLNRIRVRAKEFTQTYKVREKYNNNKERLIQERRLPLLIINLRFTKAKVKWRHSIKDVV